MFPVFIAILHHVIVGIRPRLFFPGNFTFGEVNLRLANNISWVLPF